MQIALYTEIIIHVILTGLQFVTIFSGDFKPPYGNPDGMKTRVLLHLDHMVLHSDIDLIIPRAWDANPKLDRPPSDNFCMFPRTNKQAPGVTLERGSRWGTRKVVRYKGFTPSEAFCTKYAERVFGDTSVMFPSSVHHDPLHCGADTAYTGVYCVNSLGLAMARCFRWQDLESLDASCDAVAPPPPTCCEHTIVANEFNVETENGSFYATTPNPLSTLYTLVNQTTREDYFEYEEHTGCHLTFFPTSSETFCDVTFDCPEKNYTGFSSCLDGIVRSPPTCCDHIKAAHEFNVETEFGTDNETSVSVIAFSGGWLYVWEGGGAVAELTGCSVAADPTANHSETICNMMFRCRDKNHTGISRCPDSAAISPSPPTCCEHTMAAHKFIASTEIGSFYATTATPLSTPYALVNKTTHEEEHTGCHPTFTPTYSETFCDVTFKCPDKNHTAFSTCLDGAVLGEYNKILEYSAGTPSTPTCCGHTIVAHEFIASTENGSFYAMTQTPLSTLYTLVNQETHEEEHTGCHLTFFPTISETFCDVVFNCPEKNYTGSSGCLDGAVIA